MGIAALVVLTVRSMMKLRRIGTSRSDSSNEPDGRGPRPNMRCRRLPVAAFRTPSLEYQYREDDGRSRDWNMGNIPCAIATGISSRMWTTYADCQSPEAGSWFGRTHGAPKVNSLISPRPEPNISRR